MVIPWFKDFIRGDVSLRHAAEEVLKDLKEHAGFKEVDGSEDNNCDLHTWFVKFYINH